MTSNVEYRYATKEDLEAYYKDDPVYYSARAVVIVKDGEIVGVGGVCRVAKQMIVFTDIKDERVSKRDIILVGRLLTGIIDRYTSVIAYADEKLGTATSFANHFGFYSTGVQSEHGAIMMKVTKKWTK